MAIKHQNVLHQKIKYFSVISLLGQGAFAKVYEGIDERNYNQVAIKAIPKKLLKQTLKLTQLVNTEISVLKACTRQCKSQNVIKFVDSFTSQNTIFIVTQFCNGGDLEKYLQQKKRLTEDEATQFLKQILNGFKSLHQVGAMHRDFKLANVLLHNNDICKIADLGFAKQFKKSSMTTTVLGTSLTMAPQVLDQKPYGMQADLWSIGVVYYQMIFGRYPYSGLNDYDILKKIKSNRPDFSSIMISKQCRDFIDKCLTVNPKNRMQWKEVYNHPLLSKSQGRMIYHGVKSKLYLNQNKSYYQNKIQYPDFNKHSKKILQELDFQGGIQIKQSTNIINLVEQKKMKERKNKNITNYSNQYINKRNSIMFIFKFVCPHIHKLTKIKANHGISLFIMSKKAFIDMKQFLKQINFKQNIFNFSQDWNEFINTQQYQNIKRQCQEDIQMISALAISYSCDIDIMSKQVQSQLNIQNIYSKNWNQLVANTINEYWFLLAEGIDNLKNQQKSTILSVLQALDYYRQKKIADVDSFAKKIQALNFLQTQNKIKQKLISIYQ